MVPPDMRLAAVPDHTSPHARFCSFRGVLTPGAAAFFLRRVHDPAEELFRGEQSVRGGGFCESFRRSALLFFAVAVAVAVASCEPAFAGGML
jgi:hypothetical protein